MLSFFFAVLSFVAPQSAQIQLDGVSVINDPEQTGQDFGVFMSYQPLRCRSMVKKIKARSAISQLRSNHSIFVSLAKPKDVLKYQSKTVLRHRICISAKSELKATSESGRDTD